MGDIYALETPENVAVDYPIAGVGSRFLATLIDTLILVAVLVALLVVTLILGVSVGGNGLYVVAGIGVLVINIILFGYYVFFEIIWNGQTPGKRAQRLRVIGVNGYPVTPFAVLIRNVVRIVDFLPAYYAIGVITMLASRRSRRLGDLAAGTMVIKEGREGSLASLTSTPPVPPVPLTAPTAAWGSYAGAGGGYSAQPTPTWGEGAPPVLAGADVSRLTREDEALIRGFLARRASLAPRRRFALGGQIAATIHGRIGGEQPWPRAPELYLEQVLAARNSAGYGNVAYGSRTWYGHEPYARESAYGAPAGTRQGPGDGGTGDTGARGAAPLTPDDEALIRDFLARRDTLQPERRDHLAGQIAAAVYGRVGGPPPGAPEPYLEGLLASPPGNGPL